MKVKDRMTPNPYTISPETNLREAFSILKERNIRRLPVVEREKLIGMITRTDLYRAIPLPVLPDAFSGRDKLFTKTKVSEIMPQKPLITVHPNAYIEQAAKILSDNKVSGLPVVNDKGKLVGIISVIDILTAFLDMLGVNQKGTRINLHIKDNPDFLHQITDILSHHKVMAKNMVKLVDHEDNGILVIRINSLDYKPIVEEFKKEGIKVESVVLKN
ncbi:MAG: CBS and ACT domain-containing protein [Bacillota bacterium]|jgi:acetoin utilization protein AcuB